MATGLRVRHHVAVSSDGGSREGHTPRSVDQAAARIGDVGRVLAAGDCSLADATAGILETVGASRVSIAAIESDEGAFEIVEARGDALLGQGTRFPLETSTHHLAAAGDRVFVAPDFDQRRGFSRPLDRIVRAHGFRSGASLPLSHPSGRAGALNLHFNAPGDGASRACGLLEPLLGTLSVALSDPDGLATTRILICHDDPLIGHGISRLVEKMGMAGVALARSSSDAVATGTLDPPDVVIADLALDGERIDGWIGDLRAVGVDAPLVVVAAHDCTESLNVALSAGASGFVARSDVERSLHLAVDAVARGQSWLPVRGTGTSNEKLTPRELDVLKRLDSGMRFRQIAGSLGISETTVKTHARSLFVKLGATSRSEATYAARRRGLL
jgi:DNA-binding NarL/FixJ family response regulator